jgi:hypothetical protein
MAQLVLQGTVSTHDGEYPVAGVLVRARATEATSTDVAKSDTECSLELGKAVTDASGVFTIETRDDPAVARYACAMEGCAEFTYRLVCEDSDHCVLYKSEPLSYRAEVSVPIALPQSTYTPSDTEWRTLAERVQTSQTPRLGDLATELVTLAPNRIFRDWGVARRVAVASRLESALLDPSNELASAGVRVGFGLLHNDVETARLRQEFYDMHREDLVIALDKAATRADGLGEMRAINVFVEPEALKRGDVITAVNHFFNPDSVITEEMFPWLKSPLRGYRDYLRDRWTTNQRFQHVLGGEDKELCSAATMNDRLKARYHQSFTIKDVTDQPANQVLIPILMSILTSPTGGGYGYGLAAAAIDPQGDRKHREYLDYLIDKTGEDVDELEKRYRLNLRRSDFDTSNPVQQNIDTLQRFFTDSYQSDDDPFPIKPDRVTGKAELLIPQFPKDAAGPFFLEFEEWQARQEPFYPENFFDPRATYKWNILERLQPTREIVFKNSIPLGEFVDKKWKTDPSVGDRAKAKFQWVRNHIELYELFVSANASAKELNFTVAEDKYALMLTYATHLRDAVQSKVAAWDYDANAFAKKQRNADVSSIEKLDEYERRYHFYFGQHWDMDVQSLASDFLAGNTEISDRWWGKPEHPFNWPGNRRELAFLLDYLVFRLLPICLSEVQLAQGKYAEAVGQLIAPAAFNIFAASAGYDPYKGTTDGYFSHVTKGALPYATSSERSVIPPPRVPTMTPSNKAEKGYFRLKLGSHALEWADALYRSNQPESIMRARELYKGVIYLHGEDPEITPNWSHDVDFDPLELFFVRSVNPAVTGQVNRARVGFLQINAGLNFYGVGARHVPPVRYRVLQEASTRFAAGAKGAQTDFLNYMQQLDELTVNEMTARTMVTKATAALQIAKEQQKIAEYHVGEAQKQVEAVKAQIAAKRAEIAKKDSIFEQYKDFAEGMKDSVGNLAKVAFAGEGDPGAAGATSLTTGDLFKFATKLGAVNDAGGAASAFGSAGAVAGPFAAFIYSGVSSMISLADASAKRAAELKTLETVALPAAQALVTLKQRDVTITQLSQTIAQADAQLGKDLLNHYASRYRNRAFLTSMSDFSNRLMRRYLDLAGRTAWLAERALAFEQDRELGIVGFDYFPRSMLGVSGADLLQLHLAELEAARIQALTQTIPVKQTISLARDFPLAFGQLKKNGACNFATAEAPLHLDYPGTYGYRIRNVTIAATYGEPIPPHRGMLSNQGVSRVTRNTLNSAHTLVRYPDALPLSDFRMRDDMWVFDLPDETLLPFEGSGIDTVWQLVLPKIGNTGSLDSMTDFLITFDMRASYSAVLEQQHLAAAPTSTNRSTLLSGKALQPGAIGKFRKSGGVLKLAFDMKSQAANAHETSRKTTNMAVIVSGVTDAPVKVKVSSTTPAQTKIVTLDKGIALSNTGVLADGNGGVALPLNAFSGLGVDQTFTVSIETGANPGVDFGKLDDVMLVVDYSATLV